MDISALLSPSEAPPSKDSTASPVPGAAASTNRKNDSPIVRQSPRSLPHMPMASPSRQVAMQNRPPMPSPPGSNFSSHSLASNLSAQAYTPSHAMGTPPQEQQRPQMQRAPVSGMDTLADLASMQQHHQQISRSQPARQDSASRHGTPQRPRLEEMQRQHSGSRNSIDMTKLDTPKPQPRPPRVLRSASLTDTELQEATQLFEHLAEHPHAYDSHLRLTRLLRRGLRAHSLDPESNEIRHDPRTYELVRELLEANEAMSARFAIGEELWQERLQDQQMLAFSVDDCLGVIELGEQAVQQEAGSTALWQLHGNWMLMLYQAGHGVDVDMTYTFKSRWAAWSDEDKIVAREVFPRQQVLEIWRRGVEDTMFNLNDSHLIWDNYVNLVLEDLERSPSPQGLAFARDLFERRLTTPHKEWDQTFQQFSQFVSRFIEASKYEETMMWTKQRTQSAKAHYEVRAVQEMKWQSAKQARDQALEWAVVSDYLEWELGQSRKKKKFSLDLSRALYHRALLRFPHVTALWEDFFLFLTGEPRELGRSQEVLEVINRGTSHCPWSGTLWGHYIRGGELVGLSFEEMSKIKHRATSKGSLDASPLEDHLLINASWCSYLRRRAFEHGEVDEDELDVTEVGIRSAIEEMEILGKRAEGDKYQGDPSYRLERIYVRFCTQVGDGAHLQTARAVWEKLVPRCGSSYEFWQWYFLWERFIWVKNPRDINLSPNPKAATAVLTQGINTPNIDWPEKLIDDLLRHAEDYEDPAGQLQAMMTARKARKDIEKRRASEREAAQRAALEQQNGQELNVEGPDAVLANGKRKREGAEEAYDNAFKKSKLVPAGDAEMTGMDDGMAPQLKRDRENATIVVRNLPGNAHGRRVRNFFRDCGEIKSLNMTKSDDGQTSVATVEFENHDDVLAALTRDGKEFEGQTIEVQVGTGLTIWCANYPAAADETYIRDLFSKYGEIVDVRLPSIKYNTHRRFCYVQFRTSAQALAATELDGRRIQEGDAVHHLVAKISDPAHKQGRTGALEEGRELYVRDVDWNGTEDELKEIFEKYGEVQSVRIPRNMAGKSKGHAFIVFKTPEEANAALVLSKTKFKSRLLDVSIAESKTAKRSATMVVRDRVSASPSPSIAAGQSAGSPAIQTGGESIPTGSASREQIAARTISLLDVPDTVNDARIRALAEPHGALVKIILRPDHGGAIIEYADVAAAGKASLALEGFEVAPGRRIRTGTVPELLGAKSDRKDQNTGDTKAAKKDKKGSAEPKAVFAAGSGVIRRPGQQAGRRGGLGTKRGGGAFGGPRALNADGVQKSEEKMDVDATNGDEGKEGKPKSNADFKAIFIKGKE